MSTNLRNNATRIGRPVALALALSAGAFMTSSMPAFAQQDAPPAPPMQQQQPSAQQYPTDSTPLTGTLPDAWDATWDTATFDHAHYVVGTVASFTPYRLTIASPDGPTMTVDLKKGTKIRPDGLELAPGEHVAAVGYWSKGTFVVNRVVLRRV